jgi:uncharacterized membrane protein
MALPVTQRRIRPEHFRRAPHPTSAVNVGDTERWLSVLGGGALALWGLTRGSLGGWAAAALGGTLAYRGVTGHCPMYAALDIRTSARGPATTIPAHHGVKVDVVMTIRRSPQELFAFWRNFENLPRFMHHLQAVKGQGQRSHWVARAPLGMKVEWDAEVYNERPNELIAWRSLEGADVDNTGSVHFTRAPGDHGTEVRVVLKYDPPAGKLGAVVARLFGEAPEQQIREDLRRFKQLMEAGEVPTVEGQTSCRAR